MKTLHLTDDQHDVLQGLVNRGLEDLRKYLQEVNDPRVDGYSDEEVEELEWINIEMGEVIQKCLNGLQPPPGYEVRCDGLFGEPYYVIENDDFGTIVTATYVYRENAVRAAWDVYN